MVCQVESLEHQLQIPAFTDFDVLRNAGIHVEKRISTLGVIRSNHAVAAVIALRGTELVYNELSRVSWIRLKKRGQIALIVLGYDKRACITAATEVQLINAGDRVVGTC